MRLIKRFLTVAIATVIAIGCIPIHTYAETADTEQICSYDEIYKEIDQNQTIDIQGRILWDDVLKSDAVDTHTTTIELINLETKEVYDTQVATDTFTFKNVPKIRDGEKITYGVLELMDPNEYVVDVGTLADNFVTDNLKYRIMQVKYDNPEQEIIFVNTKHYADINKLTEDTKTHHSIEHTIILVDDDMQNDISKLACNFYDDDEKLLTSRNIDNNISTYVFDYNDGNIYEDTETEKLFTYNEKIKTCIMENVPKIYDENGKEEKMDITRCPNTFPHFTFDGQELSLLKMKERTTGWGSGGSSRAYEHYLEFYKKTKCLRTNTIWDDDDNCDKIRKFAENNIIINYNNISIKQNGHMLSAQCETMDCVSVYHNEQKINYDVEACKIPGYTSTIIRNNDYDFTITYTHIPYTVNVNGNITWKDDNNKENTRPKETTIELYADGKKVDETTTNDTTYTFDNVPKNKDGQEITYTITEKTPEDYSVKITGFDVTNTLNKDDTTPNETDTKKDDTTPNETDTKKDDTTPSETDTKKDDTTPTDNTDNKDDKINEDIPTNNNDKENTQNENKNEDLNNLTENVTSQNNDNDGNNNMQNDRPQTGDNSPIVVYVVSILAATVVLVFVYKKKNKNK